MIVVNNMRVSDVCIYSYDTCIRMIRVGYVFDTCIIRVSNVKLYASGAL